jgi:hypothetical protein
LPIHVRGALTAFFSVIVVAGCKGSPEASKAAASAAPSASAAPPARTVRLEHQAATIGEKRHTMHTTELTLSVEFWQESEKLGTADSHRKETYDRTLQVLGLVGDEPAKAHVHYDHYESHETAPNKPAVDSKALDGKSYVLDAADGTLQIEGDGGKAVTREETDALRKLHADLGKDDPVVASIGDAPITLGKPLSMRKELLRALLTSESGELKSGRIWLEQVKTEGGREVAVFEWTADTHSQEDNGLEITWHMSGDAVIALAPAVTLSTSLKGSLDVSGTTYQHGARVTLAGAGSIADEGTTAIAPP